MKQHYQNITKTLSTRWQSVTYRLCKKKFDATLLKLPNQLKKLYKNLKTTLQEIKKITK